MGRKPLSQDPVSAVMHSLFTASSAEAFLAEHPGIMDFCVLAVRQNGYSRDMLKHLPDEFKAGGESSDAESAINLAFFLMQTSERWNLEPLPCMGGQPVAKKRAVAKKDKKAKTDDGDPDVPKTKTGKIIEFLGGRDKALGEFERRQAKGENAKHVATAASAKFDSTISVNDVHNALATLKKQK